MAMVVIGLMKDPHQARGVVRALDDAGFDREEIDTAGLVAGLTEMGLPEDEAHSFAEGARRGGTVVCVHGEDESEAEQAAQIMAEHGALDIDACAAGWKSEGWSGRIAEPQQAVVGESYAASLGEYPTGIAKMYRDPRTRPSPATRTPGTAPDKPYEGPERRQRDQPYVGINRRAV
jgi:hypothetical protein